MKVALMSFTLTLEEDGGVGRPAALRKEQPDIEIDTGFDGIPHVPGTSLAGALRARVAQVRPERVGTWFGSAPAGREDDATASPLWVLDASLADPMARVFAKAQPDYAEHQRIKTSTTAINRDSGAALDKTLREVVSLAAGSAFTAYLRWDDPDTSDLQAFVAALDGWSPLIGRATSTGHGRSLISGVRVGWLDLTQRSDLITWLSNSGPELFEAVLESLDVTDPAPAVQRAFRVNLDTVGPFSFSLNSKGELTSTAYPGASVKGVFRSRTEYILRSVGLLDADKCIQQSCGDCWACRLYGHSNRDHAPGQAVGQRGRLRVLAAPVADPQNARLRSHAPLDRVTGGVGQQTKDDGVIYPPSQRGGMLHTMEAYEATSLQLTFEVDEALSDEELSVFASLLRLVLTDIDDGLVGLGRATTRGYGGFTLGEATDPDGSRLMELDKAQQTLRNLCDTYRTSAQASGEAPTAALSGMTR